MNKLPIEIKTKWVAALRSGEYQQCRGQMFKDGGHCCLGVLAVVTGVNKTDDPYSNLPEPLAGGYGNSKAVKLIYLNDGSRNQGIKEHSFEEIADYIEQHL